MKALLLSAGLGTRLRPLTDTVPKCLVKINGRPLMDYWLYALFGSGVERVLINLFYLSDQVLSYVENSPWRDRIDLVKEDALLGTAGTLRTNFEYFKDEPFLVAHADNFCLADFTAFIQNYSAQPKDILATMMTFRTADPSHCGIVELGDGHQVLAFHEKVEEPPGDLANGAVYIMSPRVLGILKRIAVETPDISIDLIPVLLPHIVSWENKNSHLDVGSFERLEAAQVAAVKHQKLISSYGWFKGGN